MKNALDWIKSNPVSAASIVVAFLGIVVFLFVLFVQAPALRKRVIAENDKQANELKTLTSATIILPNPDPNGEPIPVPNLVINQSVIDFVQVVNEEVRSQSASIKGGTRARNANAHLNNTFANGQVFGNAQPNSSQIAQATLDYRNSFEAMFVEGYEDLAMPKMIAGLPPSPEEVYASVDQMLYEYLTSVGAESTSDLTQTQANELLQLQKVAAMAPLRERAESIHLYADVMPLEVDEGSEDAGPEAIGMERFSQDYPFLIADWSVAAEQAKLDQLWEGQVQVWVIRDIMQAIANTNTVTTTTDDGATETVQLAVLHAPVKRLIRLELLPGYVGLHNGGAISPTAGAASPGGGAAAPGGLGGAMMPGGRGMPGGAGRGGRAPGRPGAMPGGGGSLPTPGGPAPGGAAPGASPEIDPNTGEPIASATPAAPTVEVSTEYNPPIVTTLPPADQPIVDSFFFGPTGRFSNNVFDVRHVTLTLHIEWASLPLFFEQLRQVNFMTVLDMSVVDVDEYAMLADGYVYNSDVVEVQMVIETLWFRDWTTELMPQIVKNALAVPETP
ncbi:MAG: hypothetical protein ACIAXF_15260 [Phycisphaerales bacterium JB063]